MPTVLLLAALFAATAASAQWEIQSAPTTADLRGIDNVGKGIAWASGSDGTILHTTDDGAHWQHCATPPDAEKLDFRGIQAFDEKTAIVMSTGKGPLSRLYKTTDGCQTWTLLFTNPDPDGFWDSIAFEAAVPTGSRPRMGYLLGDPVSGDFVIYDSSDAGETWHPFWCPASKCKPAKARQGESVFAASNSAMVVNPYRSSEPLAFVTGGVGGVRVFLPQEHSPFDASYWWAFSTKTLPFPHSPTSGAFSVAANGRDLMVVGGDYATPNRSGNSTFVPFSPTPESATKSATPPHGFRSAVAYSPTTKTWITVGPNGTDISTDDGRNWRALKPTATEPPDADQHWNALSLPFVVGPHGRIGRLKSGVP